MSIRKRESTKLNGKPTYQVRFRYTDYSGNLRYHYKGGFKTKKDAQAYESMKKSELLQYGTLYDLTQKTLNEVYEEYMEVDGGKYAPSTKQYYYYTHHGLIKNSIGNRKITTLKYKELKMYFDSLDTYDKAKNAKKVLNVTFKYAIRQGYIKDNPMPNVSINKKKEKDDSVKTITKEELDQIVEEMIQIRSKHYPNKDASQFAFYSYSVALYIGYYTGLRVSEALGLGLHKSDFDFQQNTINIQRRLEYSVVVKKKTLHTVDKLKTSGSKATIPLAEPLKDILLKWFEYNPYEIVVCDIEGNYIHPSSLNARLRKVCSILGIQFHFHMLRHTFTSNLIESGANPSVVKELARHSDIKTTLNIYTHVSEDEQRKALDHAFNKNGDGHNG